MEKNRNRVGFFVKFNDDDGFEHHFSDVKTAFDVFKKRFSPEKPSPQKRENINGVCFLHMD